MFRKSSRCRTDQPMCAEVEVTADRVALRNSERPTEVMWLTHDEWRVFLAGVKAGEFDVDTAGGTKRVSTD